MSWFKGVFNSVFNSQLKLLGILSALFAGVISSAVFFQQTTESIFREFSWSSLSRLSAFNYGQLLVYFAYLLIGLAGFFLICLPLGFGLCWLIYRDKFAILAGRNLAMVKSQIEEIETEFDEIDDIVQEGKLAEAAEKMAKSKLLTGKSKKDVKLELANLAKDAMNRGEYDEAVKMYESALQIEKDIPAPSNKTELLINKFKYYLAGYGIGVLASITLILIGFFSILLLPLILGVIVFSMIFALLFLLVD